MYIRFDQGENLHRSSNHRKTFLARRFRLKNLILANQAKRLWRKSQRVLKGTESQDYINVLLVLSI